MFSRTSGACLLIFCICVLGFSVVNAAEFLLIIEPDEGQQAVMLRQKAEPTGHVTSSRRWRRVDLLKQVAQVDGIGTGDELVLNLFPDATYRTTIDLVSVNVHGTITIRGRLRDYPLGYVLISTTGDHSLATIRVPELGVEYTIVYDPDSCGHYLLDHDPAKQDKLEEAPSVIPSPPSPEEQQEINALQERIQLDQPQDSPVTVDVLVVYTPAARTWAVTYEGSISNTIAQAMAIGQLVADNSDTLLTVNLVHSAEVSYTESGDTWVDLDRLRMLTDGFLDKVHTLRNTYGADLVVLLEQISDTGGLGYYLVNTQSGLPAYGFSISRVQQASSTHTMIHEIGHNMGAGHHKAQNTHPGPGLYPYSAGWRWTGTDGGHYCSIMTYEIGSYFTDGITHNRVAYFSNPRITNHGKAIGDAANGDNARTVYETKTVIAAYRQATPSCSYSLSPGANGFAVTSTQGDITVIPASSSCSWTAASNASWITITSGSSLTGGGIVTYSVAANTTGSTRTGTITVAGSTITITQTAFNASLYFPHIATIDSWQTEIAIINTGSQTVTGTLRALSDKGQLIGIKDIALSARGRRQIIIANEFTNHTEIGQIIFDTNSAAVLGYAKFYIEGVYRVAIPAVQEINTSDIYVPHIASSTEWWTGLSLVNTNATTKTVNINFSDGRTKQVTLAAHEHQAFAIRELFNNQNQPQPGIQSAVITNASGVIGLVMFGGIGSSNQMDGMLLTGNTATTLYYPHVANDGWWTGIVAYNPSESDCTITITPYTVDGSPLSPNLPDPIEGKGKYIGVVADLGLSSETAWFKIDSTRPLSGFELFGTTNGNQLGAYASGGATAAKTGVFPKIEKSGWTGIALINTEDGPASVTLTAYNDNGTTLANRMLTIGSYAKVVNTAESIFSKDISSATYIVYSSGRNVVGFQLNGSADGTMLDGLPGL